MLTKDTPRVWESGHVNEFTLAPGALIYQGAAVGDNGTGLARPLVTGDKFLGFAESTVGTAEGNKSVRVLASGLVQLYVSNLKATSLYALVYASNDNSFSLAQGSVVGTVYRVLSNGEAIVAFGQSAYPPLAPHRLLMAGQYKTVGGAVLEKIPLPGLLASDIVQVMLASPGKPPCMVQSATPTVNSLHVTFSADPGSDHVLHYVVYRTMTVQ
jgi:hypothetical protein